MAIEQPTGTNTLDAPSHSKAHRAYGWDGSTPDKSCVLDDLGIGPWGIDAEAYGAVGDGTADDTNAINNAIATGTGGCVMLKPNKIYDVTDIQPQSYTTLNCNGAILRYTGTATLFKNDSGSPIDHFSFLNPKLRTKDNGNGTAIGLRIAHIRSSYFLNPDIRGFDKGIYFAAIGEIGGGNYYNTFVNPFCTENNTGIEFFTEGTLTYKATNCTTFIQPRINKNKQYAIRAVGDATNSGEFHGSGNIFLGGEVGGTTHMTRVMDWSVNAAHKGNGFFFTRFETPGVLNGTAHVFGTNSDNNFLHKCVSVGGFAWEKSGFNEFDTSSVPYPNIYADAEGKQVSSYRVIGDTNARFAISLIPNGDTRLEFGPGDAATDVYLYRESAGAYLRCSKKFWATDLWCNNDLEGGHVIIHADKGMGVSGEVTLTNLTEGVGTQDCSLPKADSSHGPTGTAGSGWWKMYDGTKVKWIPYWTDGP